MDGLDDIPIERLTPQFIQDFSIYLSADKGLRGGTDKPQLSYARDVFVFAAGFWDIRTSPPRRFMPRLPCRN